MICTPSVRLTPCQQQIPWRKTLSRPDLNLLFTLDVLLAEGSVARGV
jgi:hypothetical protein